MDDARHIPPYTPGVYEGAVTSASRAYAAGEMNVTEFRNRLRVLRIAYNRVPSNVNNWA